MARLFSLCLFLGLGLSSLAQSRLSWEQLTDVSFPKLPDQTKDTLGYYPIYGSSLVQRHGKPATMEGFIIVVDATKGHYVLSRHPFAACYFCGGGGVESIVDVSFAKAPDLLATDDYVILRGTFFLNPENLDYGIYLLKGAAVKE